ncbi:MAG: redoxin domain-containing protein [Myxococcales bacterium]|jgi:peroxiredoxin
MAIQVGADAPDFELASSEANAEGKTGKAIKLSDFRGKKNVVLVFYPLDFSPVCSGEHACFREDFAALDGTGAQILGISVDSVWSHAAYKKQLGITYPLLADFHPRGAVASKFGLYLEERGITARATVIIDKNGKVVWVKEQGLGDPRDNQAILDQLKQLA